MKLFVTALALVVVHGCDCAGLCGGEPLTCATDADCTGPDEVCAEVYDLGRICAGPGREGFACTQASECLCGLACAANVGNVQSCTVQECNVGEDCETGACIIHEGGQGRRCGEPAAAGEDCLLTLDGSDRNPLLSVTCAEGLECVLSETVGDLSTSSCQ